MSTDLQSTQAFSISDVERDTGLAKETLRVWERRYAFPQPQRDAYGERSYPFDQVQKLRMVKHLLDMGYRPGKIMQHSTGELQQMANGGAAAPRATPPNWRPIWPCAAVTAWASWAKPCAARWPCWV